jgi:murein DD-endopeptidase MepM/ murein hydrolase activator NlpD
LALTVAAFLTPTQINAQSQIQPVEQRRSPNPKDPRSQSTNQIVKADAPEPETKTSDDASINAAVEAALPKAVVPPAPYVIKRSPNAISIPADALDKESDYQEQPVSSVSIGSRFGVRRDPFTHRSKFHAGVDIKARWGDAVGASYAGTVAFVGWRHGYGNLVIVAHGGGIATHYAHLSSFDVEVGEHVERGTIIGRAGSTGRATSPHLHYEVRVEGNAVNPFSTLVLDPDSPYFKQSRTAVQQEEKVASKAPAANKETPPANGSSPQPATQTKVKEQH